jgi:hypothetical protein
MPESPAVPESVPELVPEPELAPEPELPELVPEPDPELDPDPELVLEPEVEPDEPPVLASSPEPRSPVVEEEPQDAATQAATPRAAAHIRRSSMHAGYATASGRSVFHWQHNDASPTDERAHE